MAYEKDAVARHFKAQMALADMSVEQLSKESGVSVDTIRNVLRGKTSPLLKTTIRLAETLGCTPNDLCGIREVGA